MTRPVANWLSPIADILAGTAGGAAGKLIEFPFDTLKVRLQAASTGKYVIQP
jgi:Mitochondrial carrier protein